MKLKKHKFGQTHLRVSELCLGTSNFARYADQEESFAILDAFREAGGNFLQTSGICPGISLGDGFLGMPEELLGRWLRDRKVNRDGIVIATRIALTRPIIGGVETYIELIRGCTEDSIRRLRCGFLDFLVVEWTDAILPMPESVAAFEAIASSGEIRHIVPANFPSRRVLEALAASRRDPGVFAGLQLDSPLGIRSGLDASAVRICADHALGAIARSPISGGHVASRGLTSNDLGSRRAALDGVPLWPVLSATARTRRASPAKVALAWVLAHPQITSVLISVSSVDQLHALLAATRLSLTEAETNRLGGGPQRLQVAALSV